MNSKEETRTVWFRTWIKWLLISLIWRGLELCFYGEARESNEDTIISLVLLWYIWKSEALKIGAWTRRKRNRERSNSRLHRCIPGKLPESTGQDAQSRSCHSDSDGCHYGFKNDRCAERTEAASTAADQSNGGIIWSYDATGSAEPARGR